VFALRPREPEDVAVGGAVDGSVAVADHAPYPPALLMQRHFLEIGVPFAVERDAGRQRMGTGPAHTAESERDAQEMPQGGLHTRILTRPANGRKTPPPSKGRIGRGLRQIGRGAAANAAIVIFAGFGLHARVGPGAAVLQLEPFGVELAIPPGQ